MAEGADGEEEIQFLRTVSDAAALSTLKETHTVRMGSRWIIGWHYCAFSHDKVLRSLLL